MGGGEAVIGLRLSRARERGWVIPGNVFVKECPIVFGKRPQVLILIWLYMELSSHTVPGQRVQTDKQRFLSFTKSVSISEFMARTIAQNIATD